MFHLPDPASTDPLDDTAATAALHPGLRHAPATARNRKPIREALVELLPGRLQTIDIHHSPRWIQTDLE